MDYDNDLDAYLSSLLARTDDLLEQDVAPLAQAESHTSWRVGQGLVPEDLVIVSSDSLHFHVHQNYLAAISYNSFGGSIPLPPVCYEGLVGPLALPLLYSPYSATVLNLSLLAMYNVDVEATEPIASLAELTSSITALTAYGIPLQTSITPLSLIFASFSTYCHQPSHALTVYAIASSNCPGLHHLAVYASQFLLSLDLSSITDEMASQVDAVYLHKLFILHMSRVREFKQLAAALPRPHNHENPQASGSPCTENNSGTWNELWAIICAFLTWCATPDLKRVTIRSVLPSVVNRLSCEVCKTALVDRFDELCDSWEAVKKTI